MKHARESSALTKRGEIRLLSGPLWEKLVLLAIIFIPFQYALTIQIGFPLKISELLVVAGLGAYVLTSRKVRIRWDAASLLVTVLAVTLAFSSIGNFLPTRAYVPSPGYDRGLQEDLLLYFGYGIFALAFWSVMRRIDFTLIARAIVASIWACGAAVLLQWTASITGNSSIIEALGFRIIGVGGDAATLRSGPFLEGQHLGFFAGAALLVAVYRKSYAAAVVAAASILYSQSTTAYVGLAIGALVLLVLRLRAKALVPLFGLGLVGVILVLTVTPFRNVLGRQLAKLGFTDFAPDYLYATTSLDVRQIKTEIAFRMMQDNPIIGVGPGRFGSHFGEYSGDFPLPWNYYSGVIRPIAENAYGHIGAELGLIALAVFIGLIVYLIFRGRLGPPMLLVLAGYLAVSVSTQSSWTFLPIWTFLALLSARTSEARPQQSGRGKRPRRLPSRVG